jgi:hypothetical protein
MDILVLAVVGSLNILCFFAGAKIGQAVEKGKDIEVPTINPVKIAKEHKSKKAAESEQNKIKTLLENVDAYDGTSIGQKDLPR